MPATQFRAEALLQEPFPLIAALSRRRGSSEEPDLVVRRRRGRLPHDTQPLILVAAPSRGRVHATYPRVEDAPQPNIDTNVDAAGRNARATVAAPFKARLKSKL